VFQRPSGRWAFSIQNIWAPGTTLDERRNLERTFDTYEEALLARRQAVVDLLPSVESSLELEREISTDRKARLYDLEKPRVHSDWPNVSFNSVCTWRPWCGQVVSGKYPGGERFRKQCETELEAALWAVNKKLELGHGPKGRLEERRQAILEAMKEENEVR
jgi:hypothetical protein